VYVLLFDKVYDISGFRFTTCPVEVHKSKVIAFQVQLESGLIKFREKVI
jgi:hypothetical protein